MTAAAKHLTPVTLELGGKSPCIVDASADLDVTARRIVWGKFFNAGQTCVAPDYVLVHESVHDALVARLKATVKKFWGEQPRTSPDFARIVNKRHHERLCALLGSGDVVVGGDADEDELFIAPTVLINVSPDSAVMQEEIFGPILPVLSMRSTDDAIRFIKGRDKPLALYVFASDEQVQRRVLSRTSSGGGDREPCVAPPRCAGVALRWGRRKRHGRVPRSRIVRDLLSSQVGVGEVDEG